MKLCIPHDIATTWRTWAALAKPHEVQAFGKVQIVTPEKGDPYAVVMAICLPKQTIGSVSVVSDGLAVAQAGYELREVEGLLWWIHSHVEMNAFWSGTDHAAMRELSSHDEGVFATVTNLKGEHLSAYCPPGPVRLAHQIDAVWCEPEDKPGDVEAFKARVTIEKPKPKASKGGVGKQGRLILTPDDPLEAEEGHWWSQLMTPSVLDLGDRLSKPAKSKRATKREWRELVREVREVWEQYLESEALAKVIKTIHESRKDGLTIDDARTVADAEAEAEFYAACEPASEVRIVEVRS